MNSSIKITSVFSLQCFLNYSTGRSRPLGHLTIFLRMFTNFFNLGKFVKIREFFRRGNEFSIYDVHQPPAAHVNLSKTLVLGFTYWKWFASVVFKGSSYSSLSCKINTMVYGITFSSVVIFWAPRLASMEQVHHMQHW